MASAQTYMEESKTALARKLASARGAIENMREKAEEVAAETLSTVTTVGTAFGFAYARGRWGDDKDELRVLDVPLELVVGAVAKGVGFFGGLGKYSSLAQGVGNGALCAYVTILGFDLGLAAKEKTGAAGELGVGGPSGAYAPSQGAYRAAA